MELKLIYHRGYPGLKQNPEVLLKKFPFTLPKSYLKILKEHDGGFLDYDFDYYDNNFKEHMSAGIGVIFGLGNNENENIVLEYNTRPYFFPKGLVAFGENGGGDYSCFDYRMEPRSKNPPIVFWSHDAEEEKAISFVAKNFKEFLSILKEPED